MTQQDWNLYMSSLASAHKMIGHSSTECHFFRGELDEFFDGFRSKVNYPALIMESTLLDINADRPNRQQLRTIAFMVADNVRRDDHDDIDAAKARCESIATDIVGKMIYDTEHLQNFAGCAVLDVHGEPLINEPSHYVGWRMELVMREGMTACYNKTRWIQNEGDNN